MKQGLDVLNGWNGRQTVRAKRFEAVLVYCVLALQRGNLKKRKKGITSKRTKNIKNPITMMPNNPQKT